MMMWCGNIANLRCGAWYVEPKIVRMQISRRPWLYHDSTIRAKGNLYTSNLQTDTLVNGLLISGEQIYTF